MFRLGFFFRTQSIRILNNQAFPDISLGWCPTVTFSLNLIYSISQLYFMYKLSFLLHSLLDNGARMTHETLLFFCSFLYLTIIVTFIRVHCSPFSNFQICVSLIVTVFFLYISDSIHCFWQLPDDCFARSMKLGVANKCV